MLVRAVTLFLTLLCLLSLPVNAAAEAPRKLVLQGNEIFEDDEILQKAGISRLLDQKDSADYITNRIIQFYRVRGYDLVETYIVKNNKKRLQIFIDEGRLGKIVFLNINNLDFIRIRYDFRLKKKVFNRFKVRRELAYIKREFKFEEVAYRIREIKNYDKSFFQIDRDLKIPVIISKFIPYIETYAPRYIMEVRIKKRQKGVGLPYRFKWRLDWSMNTGAVPEVRFYYKSLLGKDDRFEAGFATGVLYGLDLNFTTPPRTTFARIKTGYYLPPMLKNYFTPKVGSEFYHSNTGRTDLGYEQFRYSKYRFTAAPGITLLKKLRLSVGFGYEHINYYKGIIDPGNLSPETIPPSQNFYIIQSELTYDILPFSLGRSLDRKFKITYDAFLNHADFHRLILTGEYDFDMRRHDIFSIRFHLGYNFNSTPWVYEFSVSNSFFKGFQGKNYFSNRKSSLGIEYRFSIYRDFIFTGIFSEATIFKGSGRDVSGINGGLIAGLSIRIIIADQYEWAVYGGQDWLTGTKKTQFNLYATFRKKW